MSLLVLLLF